MKIPVQEKIAELERRIQALEAQRQPTNAVSRTTLTRITTADQSRLDRMWAHFDGVFSELGKVFR